MTSSGRSRYSLEWMTTGMLLSSSSLTEPCVIRQSELLAMAGPADSVRMPKVRSLHVLPFAQENSRSSEWLLKSMCCRRNGRAFADTRPAMALAWMMKILSMICTRKLATSVIVTVRMCTYTKTSYVYARMSNIYTCTYVHTYTVRMFHVCELQCTYVRIARICTYMHINTSTDINTCIYMHIRTYVHIWIYVHIRAYTCIYMHTFIYVHTCIYVQYMHIHAYTCIHAYT